MRIFLLWLPEFVMKSAYLLICFLSASVCFRVQAGTIGSNGDSLVFTGNESFRQYLLGMNPFAYDRMITPFADEPFQSVEAGQFRFGLEPYKQLFFHPPRQLVLDTNLGVSEVNLVMGSKREQLLFLDHRQKLAKSMNGRLSYNSIVSPGFLLNSLGRYQRIMAGVDFSKGRFRSSVDFQYSRLSIDESGGILPGQDINGLSLSEYEQLKTRLQDDNRLVRDWKLDLTSDIALLKQGDSADLRPKNKGLFIGLDAGWRRFGTSYTGLVDSGFYPVVYEDSVNTVDSSGFVELRLAPSLSLRFQKSQTRFRLDVGLAVVDVSSIQSDVSANNSYKSPFVSGSFELGKLDLDLRYETVLGDWFNDGDYSWCASLNYKASGRFLSGWSGFIQQRAIAPALLLSEYNSNQFRWSNDFTKENYMKVAGRFDMWKGKVSAYVDAERVAHWVYLNDVAVPVQSEDAVSLVKSGLLVNSAWRNWRFSFSVVHAMKEGEQVRYPTFSGWSRIAYKAAFFKKGLKAELGCTAYGTQSYEAMAFMPITGMSYLQSESTSGGSPAVDFFFHAGIGKATLSFVVQRLNDGLFGFDYYLAPGYPAPPRTLKFVLRWRLYN